MNDRQRVKHIFFETGLCFCGYSLRFRAAFHAEVARFAGEHRLVLIGVYIRNLFKSRAYLLSL